MQEINESPVQDVVTEALHRARSSQGKDFSRNGMTRFFDTASYWILLFLAFSAPLLVSFAPGVPLEAGKHFFLMLGSLLALVAWLLARIKDPHFSIPRGVLAWTSLSVVVAAFAATIASGSFWASLFGAGYETGTFASIGLFFVVLYLYSLFFRDSHRISSFFLAFHASVLAVAVVQLLHTYIPSFPLLSFLADATANVVGKWNDLGIFFGLSALVSFLSIQVYDLQGFFKYLLWAVLVSSLFCLAIINFYPVWIVLLIASLGSFVYMMVPFGGGTKRISKPAIFVFMLSLLFVLSGSPDGRVGGFMVNTMKAPVAYEVRPSWSATYDVIRATLTTNSLLGVGPNRFTNQWFFARPAEINQTPFWGVDFTSGVGFIPTILVTQGLLGFLAWLLFFAAILFYGVRSLLSRKLDPHSYALVLLTGSATVYLWLFSVIYIPGNTLIFLSCVFTGLFIGALMYGEVIDSREISFARDRRLGFISVFGVIALIAGSLWGAYAGVENYWAVKKFNMGLAAAVSGDIDTAEKLFKDASSLDPQDIYSRALSEVYLARLSRVITSNEGTLEARRAQFQLVSGQAIASGRSAVEIDPSRFVNWIALGNVYQALVPAGVGGSYELAKESYEKALSLFPRSPLIHLSLARLEISKGDKAKAKVEISKALEEKNDFTPALFLYSQIAADEGNTDSAIKATEQAVLLSPQDVGVQFQLGLLYYLKKDYAKTVETMERAVALVNNYSNARYFLGLSYAALGRRTDAINQFKEIQTLNPENTEVKKILENLAEGRSALETISPPAQAPEKRESPPVPDAE